MATPYMELKDKHGNSFYCGDLGDFLIPPFPLITDFRQHARDIREMEMNANDVIVLGFPKTGSHWTMAIVHMLMKGSIEYYEFGVGSFLDMTPITRDNFAPADRPRLLNTHLMYRHLPKQVLEKKVKLVYLERNPKDAWVSFYNLLIGFEGIMNFEGTWDQYFDHMVSSGYTYGDWFDYVLDWERVQQTETELSIFVNTFEDLKKDPVGQIEKLDQFLGYNRGRELCEQIAEACHFPALKAANEKKTQGAFKPNAAGFYRKGEVGDWKNWFTVAQSEQFDRIYATRMKGSKLSYTYV